VIKLGLRNPRKKERKKNSENEFGESETLYRSKFRPATGVIRKPGSAWLEGTPAVSIILMFGFMIVVLKQTFAYADIQTNNE